MNASLRTRLLVGTALGTIVVLTAAGVTLHALIEASLLAEFDTGLAARAETLTDLVEQEDDEIELEFVEAEMIAFTRPDRPEYYQVTGADGSVMARSPALAAGDLLPVSDMVADRAIKAIQLPDGRPGRVVTHRFKARPGSWHGADQPTAVMTLALARDTLDIASAMAELRIAMCIVGAMAVLVTLGVMAILVHVGLRPARRLASVIQNIDERTLTIRLDPEQTPSELQPIVSRLNGLLARLDDAFAREKTMTANVAHELRTPLAGLRTTLEVALARDRDGTSYRTTLAECLAVCVQTQGLVEKLLLLARFDAGQNGLTKTSDCVQALLAQAWAPFAERAVQRGLDVRWDVSAEMVLETEPDLLGVVLGNLFENAVRCAESGGYVAIGAQRVNGHLGIQVANSGSQLPATSVVHVFERFWRQDTAREADGGHFGLGLSLCRTIVKGLGGQMAASSEAGGAFVVSITL